MTDDSNTTLRQIPINMDYLCAIASDSVEDGVWAIDLATGAIMEPDAYAVYGEAAADGDDAGDDDDQVTPLPGDLRTDHSDLARFIQSVRDAGLRGRLTTALHDRHAFRAFKDILSVNQQEARRKRG